MEMEQVFTELEWIMGRLVLEISRIWATKTWSFDEKPFISEFLAGFLLIDRSGLEPSERSNILGSIKGQFTTQAIARALREQWGDGDVAKRDKAKAAAAYILEEDDEDALYNNVDEHGFSQWGPEQQEAYYLEMAALPRETSSAFGVEDRATRTNVLRNSKRKVRRSQMKSQLRLPSQLLSLQAKQTVWSPMPTNWKSFSKASSILERQHR